MNAAISGRLGLAWLVEGDQCWSLSVDDGQWVARRHQESRLFLAGATDIEYLDDLTRDDVSRYLNLQVECVDAFDCVLYLLDGSLSDEVRQEAASTLHGLLEEPRVLQDLEEIYFSQPLPVSADYEGALRAVHAVPCKQAHSFLVRLGEMQPWVRRCVDAWEKIDAELFSPNQQIEAEAILMKAGFYPNLVTALAQQESLAVPKIRAFQLLQLGNIKNYRAIVTSWLDSLPQTYAEERPMIAEEDDDIEPDHSMGRRKKESGRRRHRQQHLPQSGGGVYGMVIDELAQIREKMRSRRMDRVWPDIEKLVRLQLMSPSGKEYACKSLCNLDDFAKEMDWHQIRIKLTKWAIELNPRDPVACCQHADVMYSEGDFVGALALYESTIQDHPQNVVARNGKAEVLKSMGKLPKALALYESTIQDHPQDVVARNGKAEVLKSMGKLPEALALYESTIQDHPQNVVARNGKACVLSKLGQYTLAMDCIEQIPEKLQNWVSRHIRAMLLLKVGRRHAAIEELLHGAENCPVAENRDYFVGSLAMIDLHDGKAQQADVRLSSVKSFKLQSGCKVMRAHSLALQERPAEAQVLLDTLQAPAPAVSETILELRRCLRSSPFVPSELLSEYEFQMLLAA